MLRVLNSNIRVRYIFLGKKYLRIMKKKIFILLLLAVSVVSYAQDESQLGQYIDVDGRFIKGYVDDDYSPKEPVNISYVIGNGYVPGYYYNLEGQKINGLLKYSNRDTYPRFKTSKKRRPQKIWPTDCLAYVVGSDSITVIENFYVQNHAAVFNYDKKQFAWVIGKVGGYTFYRHIRAESKNGYSYLAKKDGEKNFISFPNVPKKPKKFEETALSVFGSYAPIKKGIELGHYQYYDIPGMIKILEYKEKYDNNEQIYFDSSWDETTKKDEARHYAIIDSIKDLTFNMIYYDINGALLFKGAFTSFIPKKRHGDFVYYYPDGTVRKQVEYNYNQPQKIKEFFEKGNLQRSYKISGNTAIYEQVCDSMGKNLLDNEGNGLEVVYDPIENRQVNYNYQRNKLITAYFINSKGEKVYQLCEKNADPRNHALYRIRIKEKTNCPDCCENLFKHGYALAKYTIEPSGWVSNIELIKGIDKGCDDDILNALKSVRNEYQWKPAMVGEVNVKQEVILPINFSVRWFSWSDDYSVDYTGRVLSNLATHYLKSMQFVPNMKY